jgi:hypothetical protein
MRTPGAVGVALLAIACAVSGCAGGGGGGSGGTPKPACKPPAGGPTISFGSSIQPIFNTACALGGCHVGPVPAENLDLTQGASYKQLVGVAALEMPKLKRVKPGDADASFLVQKIEALPGLSPMPPGCQGMPCGSSGTNGARCLCPDDLAAIRQWIVECAPNNP